MALVATQELLLRLRYNSHPVTLPQRRQLLALFLPATALNHSCRPNVAISFRHSPPSEPDETRPPVTIQVCETPLFQTYFLGTDSSCRVLPQTEPDQTTTLAVIGRLTSVYLKGEQCAFRIQSQ